MKQRAYSIVLVTLATACAAPSSDDGTIGSASDPITQNGSTYGGTGPINVAGYCLDAANGGATNGDLVTLQPCNGSVEQRWTFGISGQLYTPGSRTVRGVLLTQAGKCLDVAGWNTADGAPLDVSDCTGWVNQLWTVSIGGSTTSATIESNMWRPSGQGCIYMPNSVYGLVSGSTASLSACTEAGSIFVFSSIAGWFPGNGQTKPFSPINLGSECLEAMGTNDGAAVELQPCDGDPSQTWMVNEITQVTGREITATLMNYNGKCLDVTGWDTTNGTPLEVWDCTGAKNQSFDITILSSSATEVSSMIGTHPYVVSWSASPGADVMLSQWPQASWSFASTSTWFAPNPANVQQSGAGIAPVWGEYGAYE